MKFNMKALLVYVLGSFLIVTVFGTAEPVPPGTEPPVTEPPVTESPPEIKCGRNMIPTSCNPCNQVCNEPPRLCAQFCVEDVRFCRCKDGFSLPEENSNFCVPTKRCRTLKPTCPPPK